MWAITYIFRVCYSYDFSHILTLLFYINISNENWKTPLTYDCYLTSTYMTFNSSILLIKSGFTLYNCFKKIHNN